MSTNGVLSFNEGVSAYVPDAFPVADQPLIAVFWGDVDITEGGDITYRQVPRGFDASCFNNLPVLHCYTIKQRQL